MGMCSIKKKKKKEEVKRGKKTEYKTKSKSNKRAK